MPLRKARGDHGGHSADVHGTLPHFAGDCSLGATLFSITELPKTAAIPTLNVGIAVV